jgi:hypothetical protein
MMSDLITRRILRTVAIVIAVVAAIDPSITSNRTTRPEVAVVAVDAHRDSALADRVSRNLAKRFTVTRAAVSNAEGTVVVGSNLPSNTGDVALPAFALVPERGATVTFDAVRAPAWSPREARVVVSTIARVAGGRGRTLDVTLRAGGLVVDHVTRRVSSDDERVPVSLAFVPTVAGAALLRVSATLGGEPNPATTDLAVDVRDKRWAVLFFDPRPSWMSTFVRRAVERDPRFVVTSRVVTSRNVSTDAGQPPGRLDDLAALGLFDAVVVGAPEALSERDVVGLDAFLRRRGGGVVLLFDRRAAGPYERLTEVGAWVDDSTGRTVSIAPVNGDSAMGGLRASDIAWPSRLPAGAESVALTVPLLRDTASGHPVVWRSAVGAGRLVVNGALDSWRFRDRVLAGASGFDRFWETIIAEVANASPPPVAVTLANGALAPGEEFAVTVTGRDAALSAEPVVRASVGAVLESSNSGDAPTPVRLWPSGPAGQFEGVVRAPAAAGVYRLVVSADGNRGDAAVVVAANVVHSGPDAPDLLGAWVNARGGRVLAESRLEELSGALSGAIHPQPRLEIWNPMRSGWWMVPFAFALSGEWWLRRRRGLA